MRLFRLGHKNKRPKEDQPADLTFKYGTHLPVLQSLLEVFQPRGILELGVGKVSTPLFYSHGRKLVSIETNRLWFDEISGAFPERPGFTLIHHVLDGISERTKIDAIPQRTKEDCVKYYRRIMADNPDLDLLFIDHVSGLRAFTLASLHPSFDFVVYHDAEDQGYGYELFSRHDQGSHFHFVLRTFVPFTGFLIRKTLVTKLPEFKRVLDRHTREYFAQKYHFDLKELARAG